MAVQGIKKGQVWSNIHNGHKITIDEVTDITVYAVGGVGTDIESFKANWVLEGDNSKGQKHYNNENGSLYKFCEEKGLNSYEFDIIKRVMRCRKKGQFLEDLEKTKFLIDLYIKEYNK